MEISIDRSCAWAKQSRVQTISLKTFLSPWTILGLFWALSCDLGALSGRFGCVLRVFCLSCFCCFFAAAAARDRTAAGGNRTADLEEASRAPDHRANRGATTKHARQRGEGFFIALLITTGS